MAKKTLAEQIAELSKSEVPDFDIEDSERAVFEHSASESEDDEDDEALKTEHYLKVSKSKLRDNGIHLRDAKYVGRASSRKDIFEDSEHDLSVESDEIGEEDDEDEDEDGTHSEDSNEVLQKDKVFQSTSDSQSEQIEEQYNLSSFTSSSDEENSDSEPSIEPKNTDSKRQKLKQFMASERKHIISRLSASTQTDALKGFAVISQQKTFDKIIDTRIKLQKALTNANALPLNKKTFEEIKGSDTESFLESAEESVMTLLDTILKLRTKIFNEGNTTKDKLIYRSKKRSFGEYLSETEKLDGYLNKHRDSVLTKWSHKVQSASGAQALNTSKFKTLNQSAAQQVEVNLMDMDRLLKRTKLNRRNVVPLGRTESKEEDVKMDRSLKEDMDVFDDEDFYRVLLNDLVDKKISESNPTTGLVITKTKVKKNVDTKASKGRKLKFTIQDRIQNYEAPKGNFKWDNEQIDEFFAGLLGQRVDFAENSDEESEAGEDDEEVKNDDLRVFG